jgi:carboxylesterase type B
MVLAEIFAPRADHPFSQPRIVYTLTSTLLLPPTLGATFRFLCGFTAVLTHFGSTSNPGLDGSYFAQATNSIVIVIQYRLGVLGYLPPTAFDSNKNLGVQDVITALKYVNRVAASFGGDKNRVTVAGQSSGGNMVRNLLAAPSAANYFSRAILQSDPIVSKTHT